MAFHGLDGVRARRILVREFGHSVYGASATPAASASVAGHVVRYVGRGEAILSSRRGATVAFSSVPLRSTLGHGRLAPVDLSLRKRRGGLAPVNPLAALVIGSRLGQGAAVGSDGVRLVMDGRSNAPGALLGGRAVSFSNVADDLDAVVSPTTGGAEFYALLRSQASPQELGYSVVMPAGATLRASGDGGAEVVAGSRVLADIMAPVAADAQGSPVPVRMTVVGSTLRLAVAHRTGGFAYPVLVDPQVTVPYQGSWFWNGLPGTSPGHSAFQANWGNYSAGNPQDLVASAGTYVGSPTDRVQWLWQGGNVYSADAGGSYLDTWKLFNVTESNYDTSGALYGSLAAFGCYYSDARYDSPVGGGGPQILNQSLTAQRWQVCSSGGDRAGLSNYIYNYAGTAAGPVVSAVGAVLMTITYNCVSDCPASNDPPPSAYFGGHNPAAPNMNTPNCGAPVICATGNQYEAQPDLGIPGRGVGLSLVRTYNSQAAAAASSPGAFGYGWSSSFSDHLLVNHTTNTATVVSADGSTASFAITQSGFSPMPWVHSTLVQNGDGTYTYTLPNQVSMHFGTDGALFSEADRNGEATTLSYNTEGQVTQITDPAGRSIALTYNPDGTVSQAQDSAGRSVSYAYTSGNLTSVTDVRGKQWTFGYDVLHQLTSETDPLNDTITTVYDDSHRVTSQTDAEQRTRTWSYSQTSSGPKTVVTNPGGSVSTEQYNTGYLPTSITVASGTSLAATTTYAYDPAEDLAAQTDSNGHTTTFQYDANGNRTGMTDALGRWRTWSYDAMNDVTSYTTPSGETTTITYTAHGDRASLSRPLKQTSQTQTWSWAHGNSSHPGDVTTMTDPDNHTTNYSYDNAGDLASVTDATGDETTYTYDSAGRVSSAVSPRGNATGANPSDYTTTFTYDAAGHRTSATDPLGHAYSWDYDAAGNLKDSTDPNNHQTSYAYDADNELLTVTRPDATTLTNTYTPTGQLKTQTNGANHTTTYAYDARNHLSSVTDPLNRATQYTYDALGNLTSTTDPASRTTTYGYDAADEPTSITYSDNSTPNVSYAYNADGQRTRMTDGTGATTYNYDSLGRLTSTTDGNNDTTSYAYDLANNQTSITYPNNKTVTHGYDAANRETSLTDWLSNTTTFSYDPNSNLQTTTFPTSSSETDAYTYDRADQLATATFQQGTNTLASLSYQRDPNGQSTQQASTGLSDPTHNYTYNALNQLTADNSTSYAYDAADNPTTLAESSGYSYDQANQLTAGPQATYTYNALGQRTQTAPTAGTPTQYSYNQAGELTEAKQTGTYDDTYTYTGDALRATATTSAGTQHFTWGDGGSLPNLLTDGTTNYIYGPDGLPLEHIGADNNPVYYHHDQLGSTRALTNASGTVAATFSYDAYGNQTGATGTATTPLRFAGQYTDDTGLQYDRARYYDPQTGQFLSPDPLAAITRQPYAYAADSPTTATDPTGLDIDLGFASIPTPSLSGISNAAAGFGDTVTFGATAWVRQQLGIDNVDYCSTAYGAGGVGAVALTTLIPGEGEATATEEGTSVIGASEHGPEVTGFRPAVPDNPRSNLTFNEPPLQGERPSGSTYHLDPLDRGHGLGPHIDVHSPDGKVRLPAQGPFGSPFAYLPGLK